MHVLIFPPGYCGTYTSVFSAPSLLSAWLSSSLSPHELFSFHSFCGLQLLFASLSSIISIFSMLVSTFPEDLPRLVGILLGGSGGIKKLLRDVAHRSGMEGINDASGERRMSIPVSNQRVLCKGMGWHYSSV